VEIDCVLERHSALEEALKSGGRDGADGRRVLRLGEVRGWCLVQITSFGRATTELDRVLRPLLQTALPESIGRIVHAGRLRVLKIAPEGFWIIGPEEEDPAPALEATLAPAVAAVTPLTHSRTCIFIEGDASTAVLSKGVAVDLHPSVFHEDEVALTGLHHTPILIHRSGDVRYELYTLRTFARSVWEWLSDSALPFGYGIGVNPTHGSTRNSHGRTCVKTQHDAEVANMYRSLRRIFCLTGAWSALALAASPEQTSVTGASREANSAGTDQVQTCKTVANLGCLQEVVVTAEKRAEPLLSVPLSVTAVTSGEIEARGIASLQDMQYSVPGLVMADFGGPGEGRLQLDGIATAGGATGLPTLGIYLDEMPITANQAGAGMDIRLIDMERVEVLHGPQPTLYGEGSMGGTIHYVSAAPDLGRFGGNIDATIGTITDGAISDWIHGVLNVPLLSDKLGVRIAAGYETEGGWIDSTTTGAKDVNGVHIKTARATVLAKPIDGLSVSLMYLHQEHNQSYQDFGTSNRTAPTSFFPTLNDEHYDLGNLVVSYDFGFATLLSSTGFLHRDPTYGIDLSAFLVPILPGSITAVGLKIVLPQNALSEEMRLSSNNRGPLNYTIGVYYRDYRTHEVSSTMTAPGSLPFTILASDGHGSDKSLAAFAEVRYALTQRLEALIGLRHYRDEQENEQTGTTFGFPTAIPSQSGTFESNNPRFNLSYKTSGSGIVYLNVAKGFRSGGFNLQSSIPGVVIPPTYGPEELWTYQVGAKQEWLDHRLFADASVYYNDWSKIQSSVQIPNTFLSYTGNTGAASGEGASLALHAQPVPELVLSGTVGYVDMKYHTSTPTANNGDPLDLVSKWTYSASADYRRPLPWGPALIARIDFQHTSGYQITLRDAVPPIYRTPVRNVLNLRVGGDFGKFEADLYANNLTDNNGPLYPAVGTSALPVLPTPRTVGIELRTHL
jgi:heterotetrameric sarcosine oxidase gamma subunit